MAIGNPLLATWDLSGDLRIFEYVAGEFILIGLRSGITHTLSEAAITNEAQALPYVQWYGDDDGILSIRTDGASYAVCQQTDRFGEPIGTDQLFNPGAENGGGFIHCRYPIGDRAYIRGMKSGVSGGRAVRPFPDTDPTLTSVSWASEDNFRVAAVPQNVSQVLYATETAVRYRTLVLNGVATLAGGATNPGLDFVPEIIEFDRAVRSSNDVAALIARKTGNVCQSILFTEGAWQTIMDLALPAGDIVFIATSPDQRLAAISVKSGTDYTTRIFRRLGSYYSQRQDIAGIGSHLAFSEDGMLLVDVTARRCFLRQVDETFAELSDAMSGVPTDQLLGSFSRGTIEQTAISYIYDAALPVVAAGDLDLAALKFTLLGDSATYDPAETDLSTILANEVTGGLWPAGGVSIENAAAVSSGGQYYISSDEITRVIIGATGLSARYGVIYDDTADLPVVFVDFRGEVAVPTNRELVVTFPGGAFIRFEK